MPAPRRPRVSPRWTTHVAGGHRAEAHGGDPPLPPRDPPHEAPRRGPHRQRDHGGRQGTRGAVAPHERDTRGGHQPDQVARQRVRGRQDPGQYDLPRRGEERPVGAPDEGRSRGVLSRDGGEAPRAARPVRRGARVRGSRGLPLLRARGVHHRHGDQLRRWPIGGGLTSGYNHKEASMVKRRSAVAALVLGLVLGVSSLAFTQDKPARPERGERHPQIHAAMLATHVAARHLERAEHDFGCPRAQALELVKQAENELEAALAYAKANPEKGTKRAPGGTPAPGGGTPTMPAPKTQ